MLPAYTRHYNDGSSVLLFLPVHELLQGAGADWALDHTATMAAMTVAVKNLNYRWDCNVTLRWLLHVWVEPRCSHIANQGIVSRDYWPKRRGILQGFTTHMQLKQTIQGSTVRTYVLAGSAPWFVCYFYNTFVKVREPIKRAGLRILLSVKGKVVKH